MRYRAFISYSHTEQELARRLHTRLESFVVPQDLETAAAGRALGTFFLDEAVLGAAHDLSDTIRAALDDSQALVLIASPAAARSRWVNEEILYFRRRKPHAPCLAIIARGRPDAADGSDEQCYPPSLRFQVVDDHITSTAHDALGSDIVKDGEDIAFLKLVAGIIGLDYDALAQRHKKREAEVRRRQRRAFAKTYAAAARNALDAERPDRAIKYALAYLLESSSLSAGAHDGAYDPDVLNWPEAGELAAIAAEAGARLRQRVACRGHEGVIKCLAWSPDGKLLATGSGHPYGMHSGVTYDRTARVWDTATGRQLMCFTHDDSVMSVQFSPDGRRLLTATSSELNLFDMQSEENSRTFSGAFRNIAFARFTPDGRQILVGGFENRAFAIDSELGHVSSTFDHDQTLLDRFSSLFLSKFDRQFVNFRPITNVCISRDGSSMMTIGPELVTEWDLRSSKRLRRRHLPGQSFAVVSPAHDKLAFSSINAVSAYSRKPWRKLWQSASGDITIEADFTRLRLDFTPDGRQLAAATTADHSVTVLDADTGIVVNKFLGHESSINAVAYAPDGQLLASGGDDAVARLWQPLPDFRKITIAAPNFIGFDPQTGAIQTQDQRRPGRLRPIRLATWDPTTGKRLTAWTTGRDDYVRGINIYDTAWACRTPDSRLSAVGVRSGKKSIIVIHDSTAKKPRHVFKVSLPLNPYYVDLRFSDNGRVLRGVWDKAIHVWDTVTGCTLIALDRHSVGIPDGVDVFYNAKLSPDGQQMAFHFIQTGVSQGLAICDIASGKISICEQKDVRPCLSTCFSTNSERFAFVASDGRIRIIDPHGDIELDLGHDRLSLERDLFLDVLSFSPDGRRLALTDTQSLRIVDIASGFRLMEIPGRYNTPRFSPDGVWLAAEGWDHIDVWNVSHLNHTPPQLAAWLCERLANGAGVCTDEDRADTFLGDVLTGDDVQDFSEALRRRYPQLRSSATIEHDRLPPDTKRTPEHSLT